MTRPSESRRTGALAAPRRLANSTVVSPPTCRSLARCNRRRRRHRYRRRDTPFTRSGVARYPVPAIRRRAIPRSRNPASRHPVPGSEPTFSDRSPGDVCWPGESVDARSPRPYRGTAVFGTDGPWASPAARAPRSVVRVDDAAQRGRRVDGRRGAGLLPAAGTGRTGRRRRRRHVPAHGPRRTGSGPGVRGGAQSARHARVARARGRPGGRPFRRHGRVQGRAGRQDGVGHRRHRPVQHPRQVSEHTSRTRFACSENGFSSKLSNIRKLTVRPWSYRRHTCSRVVLEVFLKNTEILVCPNTPLSSTKLRN